MVRNKVETLEKIGESFDSYAESLLEKFAAYALLPENATYIEREASQEDVDKRGRAAGMLFESVKGLEGIRIVENDSIHIHFSTYDSDIFQQSKDYLAWKDYTSLNEIEFSNLASADNGEFASTAEKIIARASIYFDSDGDRFIFSMPYFDKYTAWRGTIVFYVKSGDFTDELISQDLLPLNTKSKVVAPRSSEANLETPQNVGIVFGMPYLAYKDRVFMVDSIEKKWSSAGKNETGSAQRLVIVKEKEAQDVMALVTAASSRYCKTGWVCSESVFTFSQLERVVILVCLFITIFLIVFTLFNLKHDDMVIISSRVRKFELSLFRQYLERKNTADWRALEKEFSLRRQDVNAEIIRSLGKRGKKHRKEVNLFLDQSWSELMSAMSGGRRMAEVISSYKDENKEDDIGALEEVSKENKIQALEKIPRKDPVEELEEIPEAEELEEIPEAEDIEELEEIPEAEELEELEEIPEDQSSENLSLKDDSDSAKVKFREISAEDAAKELDDISPVPEKKEKPMTEQEKKDLSSFETVTFNPFSGDNSGSDTGDAKN